MSSNGIFQSVSHNPLKRSAFDLSQSTLFNCYAGQLVPVYCREVVPGDYFSIASESVVRFQPMVAPILHPISATVHYFFVPYRLLWDQWEDFYTGGKDGKVVIAPPTVTVRDENPASSDPKIKYWRIAKGSVWDYLGFPTLTPVGSNYADAIKVSAFPFSAYKFIWNEYYRDETLQAEQVYKVNSKSLDNGELLVPDGLTSAPGNPKAVLFTRSWTKDYFTSSLPFLQRGLSASVVSGVKATFSYKSSLPGTGGYSVVLNTQGPPEVHALRDSSGRLTTDAGKYRLDAILNELSDEVITSLDVTALREAIAVQQYLELRARFGYRYTEVLKGEFNVSPTDERLDRPEYIGGSKSNLIVSEVLQTSGTEENGTVKTPQGTLAGHGIGVANSHNGNYHVKEWGLIMGIYSIMPTPTYSQGVDRQWIKQSRYDYYSPSFANLSEQPIYNVEVFGQDDGNWNKGVFAFQERFAEMRYSKDIYCNDMRDVLEYWHLGRKFSSRPFLNEEFIKCDPSLRVFAVQDEPSYIVHFGNKVTAVRPLPYQVVPGLETV